MALALESIFAVRKHEIAVAFGTGQFPFLEQVDDEFAEVNQALAGGGLGLADVVDARHHGDIIKLADGSIDAEPGRRAGGRGSPRL